MTIPQFIQYAVDKISRAFPTVTISYQHLPHEMTHFVKVVPDSIYSSDAFMELEGALYQQWIEEVGQLDEDFCLVSKESLIQLEHAHILYRPKTQPAYQISLRWADGHQDCLLETPETSIIPEKRSFSVTGVPGYEEFDEFDDSVYSLAA